MDELRFLIDRIDKMDSKYDDKLDKILYQTTKTNGRVTNIENKLVPIEKSIDDLETTRNTNSGRDKTLWIIILAGGALILAIFQQFISKK